LLVKMLVPPRPFAGLLTSSRMPGSCAFSLSPIEGEDAAVGVGVNSATVVCGNSALLYGYSRVTARCRQRWTRLQRASTPSDPRSHWGRWSGCRTVSGVCRQRGERASSSHAGPQRLGLGATADRFPARYRALFA